VVENRVYVIGLGSPKEKPKVLDATNDYEAIATRFMDSFKIIPALQADMSTPWKEFSSTEGGFKVQFPWTPQQSSIPAGSSGLMHMTSYLSAAAYTAMFFDYSETPKDLIAILELLDNLRLGEIESGLKELNPNVISECTTSFEGYPGRLLVLELSNNQIYRGKIVLVKNRVYILTATAPRDNPTTGNSYEALSLRFINSFIFMAQPLKE